MHCFYFDLKRQKIFKKVRFYYAYLIMTIWVHFVNIGKKEITGLPFIKMLSES